MNLLIVNDSGLQGGGAENRIRWLVNELLKKGICKEVHILQKKIENVRNEDVDSKVKTHICGDGKFSSYRMAKFIIEKYNIQLMQTHNMLALLPFPIIAGRRARIPVVWFPHDYWVLCAYRCFINPYKAKEEQLCTKSSFKRCSYCKNWQTSLRLKLFQHIINKANLGISPGNFVKDLYESHNILKRRWKVVFPWIDTAGFDFSKVENRDDSMVFVGPLMDYKGAWVAAEAFKYIVNDIPNAKLKFIGYQQEKGNIYRKSIEAIGQRDSTFNRMFFLGTKTRNEIMSEHCKAGVYVCPPVWPELFGQNWAEAMACGCPVVSSEIGSISELADGKVILVPPREPQKLAQAVVGVLKDKEYFKRFGEEGRKYALERFSVERAVDEMVKIYESLLIKNN